MIDCFKHKNNKSVYPNKYNDLLLINGDYLSQFPELENYVINKNYNPIYLDLDDQLEDIEHCIKSISFKNGILDVEAIDDDEKINKKIFILKIADDVDRIERKNLFEKIVNDCVEYFEENDLIDLFMETSIFLRR
jgi:hypothetical protein